jgi:hypothetical protein
MKVSPGSAGETVKATACLLHDTFSLFEPGNNNAAAIAAT